MNPATSYQEIAVSLAEKNIAELIAEYEASTTELESLFRELEALIPQPVRQEYKESFVYRYKEKTKEQAIVQKLARTISHLNAAILLAKSGYSYEQGMLQRMLDEDDQDIKILAMSLVHSDHQPVHDEYLNWFWFDTIAADSEEGYPGEPRRQKVYSYLANGPGSGPDPHGHITALKALQRGYSGLVHGASSHIFGLLDPRDMRYALRGMENTPTAWEHCADLWNCFYRAALSIHGAAAAMKRKDIAERARALCARLESFAGKDFGATKK